jgi:hypothetical protein
MASRCKIFLKTQMPFKIGRDSKRRQARMRTGHVVRAETFLAVLGKENLLKMARQMQHAAYDWRLTEWKISTCTPVRTRRMPVMSDSSVRPCPILFDLCYVSASYCGESVLIFHPRAQSQIRGGASPRALSPPQAKNERNVPRFHLGRRGGEKESCRATPRDSW